MRPGFLAPLLAAPLALGAVLGAGGPDPDPGRTVAGPPAAVGQGTARTWVTFAAGGAPSSLGVAFSAGAMRGLAQQMNLTSRCFDKDGDGRLVHGECLGDYQVNLAMPAEAAAAGVPIRWVMVNWNPEGHLAPAPPVWANPHFDVHFYLVDSAEVNAIRPGPCGEFIDCEHFRIASTPLPPAHHPEGYLDVGAAVPAMGNHLIDSADPEIRDPALGFSSTFIYGTWDGRLIFLEPMVSYRLLASRPDQCRDLKRPAAFAVPGYYPTRYCVRYDRATSEYRISLEGLVRHPTP